MYYEIIDLLIKSDEKDPFMAGLDKTMIATTFPAKPNTEMMVSMTPTTANLKSSTCNEIVVRFCIGAGGGSGVATS